MINNILKAKDRLLDKVDLGNDSILNFPLPKTGVLIGGYVKGEFIVVSGRKTSGKSSFIKQNYIIHPLLEKLEHKQLLNVKVLYFNTKNSYEEVIEKLILSYIVHKKISNKKRNKMSTSSFYRYPGAEVTLPQNVVKSLFVSIIKKFDVLIKKNYFKIVTGTQTIFEIKNIIKSSFSAYGRFDTESDSFTYSEKYEDIIPIIVIDNASMVLGEDNRNCIKNDNSAKLAVELKKLARALNAIIVLNVPSANSFTQQKGKYYVNNMEEIGPYSNIADKVFFMHNPSETSDTYVNDYEVKEFTAPNNGVNYLRMFYIKANNTGPSGVTVPYFMFPQSGRIFELPKPDEYEELNEYISIAQGLPTKEDEEEKENKENKDN